MDRFTQGGLHEDFKENCPWNGEEMSVITSGRFQPMVQEVADFEVQFRGRDLALKLSVRSLLHISEEGLENL